MEHRLEPHKKHSLGRRAFLLFLLKRIKGPVLFFILAAAIFYGERWVPPGGDIFIWTDFAARVALLTALSYLLAVIIITYLIYRVQTYTFTDEAFMLTSGYMTRSEIAALYHQIQNVNISRSPTDRLLGVSQIVILMAGSGRESGHTKIVLPALGKSKAKLVQRELIIRARRHVPAQAPAAAGTE